MKTLKIMERQVESRPRYGNRRFPVKGEYGLMTDSLKSVEALRRDLHSDAVLEHKRAVAEKHYDNLEKGSGASPGVIREAISYLRLQSDCLNEIVRSGHSGFDYSLTARKEAARMLADMAIEGYLQVPTEKLPHFFQLKDPINHIWRRILENDGRLPDDMAHLPIGPFMSEKELRDMNREEAAGLLRGCTRLYIRTLFDVAVLAEVKVQLARIDAAFEGEAGPSGSESQFY